MTRLRAPILVVDDDEDIRDILRVFIEADGHRVKVASDGRDAWKQVGTGERPALIILDWMMPHMDGEQFLRKLRASRFARIPVIILSGNEAAREKARALEASCCLKKPVEYEQLMGAIRNAVAAGSRLDAA